MPLQVDELLDYFMLAGLTCPESRREAVDLGVVVAEVIEAGIALAGARRGGRVDPVQIGDDLVDRPVQAVQVQAVEPGLGPLVAAGPVVVPRSHPTKSSTAVFRHIQVGKRSKPRSASSAAASLAAGRGHTGSPGRHRASPPRRRPRRILCSSISLRVIRARAA